MYKLTYIKYNNSEFKEYLFFEDLIEANKIKKELEKLKHITKVTIEKV